MTRTSPSAPRCASPSSSGVEAYSSGVASPSRAIRRSPAPHRIVTKILPVSGMRAGGLPIEDHRGHGRRHERLPVAAACDQAPDLGSGRDLLAPAPQDPSLEPEILEPAEL